MPDLARQLANPPGQPPLTWQPVSDCGGRNAVATFKVSAASPDNCATKGTRPIVICFVQRLRPCLRVRANQPSLHLARMRP